ncbi:uncharacterized protein STEHIDRAFT_148595 [Stereum hirsutum FP-91666 SS1]|uniref:uncharacterized protein n=1 Tax=Stereum hirsutum (strain FP-91666) TaxID=721885 RepID=UPI0004449818|nr:uncharacterized protein STEHIDRAFT_148595 [Stereum hirsutum FP-91666 SS1]EIM83784.1 hypothetical protein STEHIDRAFT_148595 [Stereum hirsutum FP-91666 SS1]
MFLVIERAERLKESMPEMIVPLTRLAELSKLDITTFFVSEVQWEDIKPPLGAAIDPYRMVVLAPTAQAVVQRLSSSFPTPSSTLLQNTTPSPYSPSLRPLWSDFISSLVSVLFMYTNDASELAYVAAALWPGFVKPVLEAYEELREEARAARGHVNEHITEPGIDDCEVGAYEDEEVGEEEGDLETIAYNARMRLIHYFSPSYTAALNDLYPRLTNALDWSRKNLPERGALDRGGRASAPNSPRKRGEREIDAAKEKAAGEAAEEEGVCRLPRMSKFVLVAAFVASTNPAKTDLRMFGRGRDERRKGRKKGGGTRKSVGGKAGNAKVPQRLLGPMVFPLDRLLAILGILLEEHDADSRPDLPDLESALSGEYTELELGRVHVLGAISELANMGFLHRASAPEKIDGPPTFRCGISYEAAMALGRDLGVGVRDLMWESY